MIILETERLILRTWKKDDIDAMAAIDQDPKVCEFLPEIGNRAATEAGVRKIMQHYKVHGYGLYAVELKLTGEFLGWTGLAIPSFEAHFTPAVEIGWRLTSNHWNRGYATEAARTVLHYAFTELNLNEVVSFTVINNKASRRVMEKIGLNHNPVDDFDHPKIDKTSKLCRHVLYRLTKEEYLNQHEDLSCEQVVSRIASHIKSGSVEVTIKSLTQNDIHPLSNAFITEGFHKTPSLFKQYYQEQNNDKRSVWVATDHNHHYLGYFTIVWNSVYPDFYKNNIPEINDLNVVPSQHQQGIGTKLLEFAENIARQQYDEIGLGVGLNEDYGPAQSLYVKRGYVPNKKGITYNCKNVTSDNIYPIDDDCLLWLTKDIRGNKL